MKINILFFHKQNSSFIEHDREILSRHYNVIDFRYKNILSIPRLILTLRKVDLAYCWFISLHTFILTILTKKPKILVAGGYDVANVPSINYGLARKRSTKYLVSYCLKRATSIISISKSNQNELKKNYSYYNSTLIPNAIDTTYFKPSGPKDPNLIITVGNINEETLIRKGIRHIHALAMYNFNQGEKYNFIIIGKINPKVKKITKTISIITPNLTYTDYVSNKELLQYYQKAKIYLQLSEHEGFGISVGEALACNCIPIVSNTYSLPEVINGFGHTVNNKDITEITQAIKKSINQIQTEGHHYIKSNYSLTTREEKLMNHINKHFIEVESNGS